MTVLTNKESISSSMAKNATAKTRLKVTHSVPVLPSGPVPQLTKSPSSCSSRRGGANSSRSTGADQRIVLQSGSPPVCVNTHSSNSIALDHKQPMNSVIDTPEPYLEPIKTISFGCESRLRSSSRKHQHTVAVGLLPPVDRHQPCDTRTVENRRRSTVSASYRSRPIPPPKVVLRKQKDGEEDNSRSTTSQKGTAAAAELDLIRQKKKKRSELAYLIVDLDSVGSPIILQPDSCHRNKIALDDSHLNLKTQPVEADSFPLRSNTMSTSIGQKPARPRPPPRVRSSASKDSLKEIPGPNELDTHRDHTKLTPSLSVHKESKDKFSGSVSEERVADQQRPRPPPRRKPPPRPVIGKMVSLPSYLSPPNKHQVVGEERKSSMPTLPSKSNVESKRTRALTESTESLDSTLSSELSSIETSARDLSSSPQRTPPSRPKPYAQRSSPTPTPPRPPSPLAHVALTRTSSLSRSGEFSDDESSKRKRLHQNLEANRPRSSVSMRPKPPPPFRPPPPNPKRLQNTIGKSKSTSDVKQPPQPTRKSPGPRPQISGPQLISSTVSRTLSFTDIQDAQSSPAEQPDYEDVESIILPPIPQKLSKSKSQTPSLTKRFSSDSNPPDLPPRGSRTDPTARRSRSPLSSTASSGSQDTGPKSVTSKDDEGPIYDAIQKLQVSGAEMEDRPGADYEVIDVSDDESVPTEPDIGGVDDYVAMNPVVVSAWEVNGTVSEERKGEKGKVSVGELAEDHPEDSYVEMHPADDPRLGERDHGGESFYWNDEEEDPIYIEMNPHEFIPPPKLYYASKDLLTKRPDLKAKKNKKPNL